MNYDVVIIGAGAAGIWSYQRMLAAGMNVCLLDAGSMLTSDENHDALRPAHHSPVQSKHYAWAGDSNGFVIDTDEPYLCTQGTDFNWIRAKRIGGRALINGHGENLVSLTEKEMFAGLTDHLSPAWPIDESDYRQRCERILGLINAQKQTLSKNDKYIAESAGFSIYSSAQETKNYFGHLRKLAFEELKLTDVHRHPNVKANTQALFFKKSKANKINSVTCLDRQSRQTFSLQAKHFILCASALESTRIVLLSNSLGTEFDRSYKKIGHFLHDHVVSCANYKLNIGTKLDELDSKDAHHGITKGRFYSAPFYNFDLSVQRGFGVQIQYEKKSTDVFISAQTFGEMLPQEENYVKLSADVKDKYGIPSLEISCRHSHHELKLASHQVQMLKSLFPDATQKSIQIQSNGTHLRSPGLSNHEGGTLRMGNDPSSSFVNSKLVNWTYDNLYVVDASVFPSQGYQNPMLTILALADFACDTIQAVS